MELSDPITKLKGVGEAVAKKLSVLSIITVLDLLEYYPRRYEDYSVVTPIAKLSPGIGTIEANISRVVGRYSRRGLHVTEAIANDDTGSLRLIWFNQPYRAESIKADSKYFISGEYGLNKQRFSMVNPSAELTSNFPINTARIVPIYRETKGLKSNVIRKAIRSAEPYFQLIEEAIPGWIAKKYKLMPKSIAVRSMHFPDEQIDLENAKRSLAFEEVFGLTLAALLNKNELLKDKTVSIEFDKDLAVEFTSSLPFKLTDEQRKVIWQIYLDMQKTSPMNRLVEGDVGTGKTVVATMAALMAIKHDYQVVFMAPTELLASQHANTIYGLMKPLNMQDQVSLLSSSLSSAQKQIAIKRLKTGDVKFMIGTHSLIQEKIELNKLGLVVIDEQHRFGVKQRQALQSKAGYMPHVLSMTATPIPRTLQLTLFGELDVSVIKKRPYTNKTIKTKIITLNQREKLYESLKPLLDKGEQVFVVCPLIVHNNGLPFRSAEKVYEELGNGVFKSYNVDLLHGKLKADEKDKKMQDFIDGKTNILVSTTIIEVGVDVPNASVMVVESSERFGLAQIHQLRGRVGRSSKQGYCYLMTDTNDNPGVRLRALESTSDGFKLAELDLKIRGPGAIYGTFQHGLLDLRVARLDDMVLIREARSAAEAFIEKNDNLLQYKELNERVTRLRSVTNLN